MVSEPDACMVIGFLLELTPISFTSYLIVPLIVESGKNKVGVTDVVSKPITSSLVVAE